MKFFSLALKNLWRSKLRSSLTSLAVIFLVAIFTLIGTVLAFLDTVMSERARDIRTVVTDRFRIPSRFDYGYFEKMTRDGYPLNEELKQIPGFHADKHNLWHFIAFSLDDKMQDNDQVFFLVALLPEKIGSMTDGLEGFDADGGLAELMRHPPKSGLPNIGILVGEDRLKKINKKVGDVFKAKSTSHRDGTAMRQPLEMDFEIVGTLPGESRWAMAGFMDYAYLDRVLKEKNSEMDGKINLAWFTLDDQPSVAQMGGVLERPEYRDIKAESAATTAGRFFEAFQGILWGVKFLLVPAICVVMMVIVSNAISITVRERTTEIAVLKVLGFGKGRILFLVLGEGMFLGVLAGLFGSLATWFLVNRVFGGIKMQLGWFPVFFVPLQALWWGPALGALTAFLGGVIPAWNACRVKVSEVFARVA